MSKVLSYAVQVYQAMEELAEPGSDEGTRYFTESYSALFRSLGISATHYSAIRMLLCVGAVEPLAHNVGYKLVRPPTVSDAESVGIRLTSTDRAAMLEQRVENIERNIGGLPIAEMFRQVESELRAIRQELAEARAEVAAQASNGNTATNQ